MSVHVTGHTAYLGVDRDPGIEQEVLDVSDPTHPRLLRFLSPADNAWLTTFQEIGHYLLAADYTSTLKVYDNSEPTNPLLVATFPVPSRATSVTLAGQYAYVSEGYSGVQVLDASDPLHLISVGVFKTPDFVPNSFVARGLLYVPARQGLAILPSSPNFQFTLEVEATPGLPVTIEAASDITFPTRWIPLVTTNAPGTPFWFTDSDVKAGSKFYRVRQP